MDAAGQGADFESLHRAMRPPLKPLNYDPDHTLTTRRLLKELERDGLVVREGDRYRLAEIEDRELRDALFYLPFAFVAE